MGDGPLLAAARARRSRRADPRGVHAARRARGAHRARAARHARHRRHVPQPRAARQDGDDARRHLARAARSSASAPRGTSPSTTASASTFPGAGERLDRLEEAVQICRALFRDERPTFERPLLLDHRRAQRAPADPQPGGPPIMIGGSGEKRTLRLVAQYADMCNVSGGPATVRHKLDVLRAHCDDVGRDPAEITTTRLGTLVLTDDADETDRVTRRSSRAWRATSSASSSPSARPTRSSTQVERARRRRRRRADLQHAALRPRHRRRAPASCSRRTSRSLAARGNASPSGSGTRPTRKLLIVNCDDLGSSRSANVAIYEALRDGVATSATLMVPCPWARDAAAMYRGEDVGVHLTLNAEWEQLPLGPDHPLPQPARRRRRLPAHRRRRVGPRRPRRGAQGVPGPDRAGDLLGLRRVAPRQPHGHAAAARPTFFDVVPRDSRSTSGSRCAWRGARAERLIGFPYRRLAEQEGVVFPDHFVLHERRLARADRRRRCSTLRPASPRSTCTPASTPTSCARRIPTGQNRVEDHALVTSRPDARRPHRARRARR